MQFESEAVTCAAGEVIVGEGQSVEMDRIAVLVPSPRRPNRTNQLNEISASRRMQGEWGTHALERKSEKQTSSVRRTTTAICGTDLHIVTRRV